MYWVLRILMLTYKIEGELIIEPQITKESSLASQKTTYGQIYICAVWLYPEH